ncbi:MAG: HAD family hydrolase [Acidimicrobiales bacterium]
MDTCKAVLFDFYGTLARAVSWGPRVEDVLARRGLAIDPDARARWDAEGGDGVDHLEHSVSRERYVAWEWTRLCRLIEGCGAPVADVTDVAADVYRAMKTFTLAAYEEVPGVLARLRQEGVTVAVCSNWDWDLDRALEGSGLADLVDVAVTSAQAGARKPHPHIYRVTLERCGVAPADAVFVGDTWYPDVEGPLAAGLRPIHVWRPEDGRPPPPAADGVPRVADLRGVLSYL